MSSVPPYHRIQYVRSFEELVETPFRDGINALCWPRKLEGDFGEIVAKLAEELGHGITTLDDESLQMLDLSEAGQRARALLLEDQRLLRERELAPVLDFIQGYDHETAEEVLPTNVQSFHADSATVQADTYLCTYHGASSEGLPNEQATCHVDVPETRALLLQEYGGEEGAGFEEFLSDHFYTLHYAAAKEPTLYSFGQGNLWRIAIQYPGCPVPPCIHRAPATVEGQPRLLLIS